MRDRKRIQVLHESEAEQQTSCRAQTPAPGNLRHAKGRLAQHHTKTFECGRTRFHVQDSTRSATSSDDNVDQLAGNDNNFHYLLTMNGGANLLVNERTLAHRLFRSVCGHHNTAAQLAID